MLFCFRCQLFRVKKIPQHLQQAKGPTLKLECVREIINNDFQSTSNKILYISSITQRKHYLLLEHSQTKEKRLSLIYQTFRSRKMKLVADIFDKNKIYDMIKLSRTKVLVITMMLGVKVYMVDLKRKYKYEIPWFSDTSKIKLLPGFNLKTRPLLLIVRYDQLQLRNIQTF